MNKNYNIICLFNDIIPTGIISAGWPSTGGSMSASGHVIIPTGIILAEWPTTGGSMSASGHVIIPTDMFLTGFSDPITKQTNPGGISQ